MYAHTNFIYRCYQQEIKESATWSEREWRRNRRGWFGGRRGRGGWKWGTFSSYSAVGETSYLIAVKHVCICIIDKWKWRQWWWRIWKGKTEASEETEQTCYTQIKSYPCQKGQWIRYLDSIQQNQHQLYRFLFFFSSYFYCNPINTFFFWCHLRRGRKSRGFWRRAQLWRGYDFRCQNR